MPSGAGLLLALSLQATFCNRLKGIGVSDLEGDKSTRALIRFAYRRGTQFLTRRRKLPGADQALAAANCLIPGQRRYAFGRDPVGKKLLQQLAVRLECKETALRNDIHFAIAVDRVVGNCGESYRSLLLSGQLLRTEVEMISRTHPDRQRFAVQQVSEGRKPFAKPPDGVEQPFDTLGNPEVTSRLARARGIVRQAAEAIVTIRRAHDPALLSKLSTALTKVEKATDDVIAVVKRHAPRTRYSASADPSQKSADTRNPQPRSLTCLHGGLSAAAGLIAKNARDLPRLWSEQPPDKSEVEAIKGRLESISQELRRARLALACPSYVGVTQRGNLTFVGDDSTGGTYLLRIRVSKHIKISFTKFKGGKKIDVEKGEYVYIGSALGKPNDSSLTRRVVRHASRTGNKPPHPIREEMLAEFPKVGLGNGDLLPSTGKHFKWNVDSLLDRSEVELIGVLLIRSGHRIEQQVGIIMEDDPATVVFERGLGANDLRGNTHLMRFEGGETWWSEVPAKLKAASRKSRWQRKEVSAGRIPGGL